VNRLRVPWLPRPLWIWIPRLDYRILDRADLPLPRDVRLVSTDDFAHRDGDWVDVIYVPPSAWIRALRFLPVVHDILHARRILRWAGRDGVILCNAGARVGKLVCLLNSLPLRRRRKILMWDSFIETKSALTKLLIRWMIRGCTVVVVYSQRLIALQSERIGAPRDRFVFLPYKANHSVNPPITLSVGGFIFSGGNSFRDYATLFEAVRGTNIPVIVSTTSPEVTHGLSVPPNVIVLSAKEPAFARLMAASAFVVLSTQAWLATGAAEATVCNAMWHGKPVIAGNDVSLSDHIDEGVTGYVVPPGDVAALRSRIVALWSDSERMREMGRRAHEHVATRLTHEHFVWRLNRLARLIASASESEIPTEAG
jgi:glycosyltransferase involved in cell wall biosynthesis